jgi:hypothetical protein
MLSRLSPLAKLTIAAALAAGLGFIPLLGLPGALWMGIASLPLPLVTSSVMHGDKVWPMAIMLTLIWPWLMPGFYLAIRPFTTPGRKHTLWVAGLTALTATGAAFIWQWVES